VKFAGYRVAHPLIHDVEVKIQTAEAKWAPTKTLELAIEDLSLEVEQLQRQFQVHVSVS
jgi:DNA-directed RNA polymerase subunit L